MHLKKLFSKSTADFWLNLLIVVLLIALLGQCAAFLAEFVKKGQTEGEIPFEMQMLSTSTQDSRLNIDGALFQPTLIAVTSEGSTSAVLNSEAVVQEVYADISLFLLDALQQEPVRITSREWNEAAAQQNYVYLQYPGEFPYQVVFAFAAAKAESDQQIRRADTYVGIREAILLPDASGKITYLFVRGRSGAYGFSLGADEDLTSDMDTFARYPQVYPDVFYRGDMRVTDNSSEFVVLDKVTARDIYVSEVGASALIANRDHLENLFRLLNYNPDKLRYHTESDGTYVYVESHGVLRMDARTIRYSAAEQGGIALSRIVGQNTTGDIYTYLRAASHIIWRLSDMDPMYTGGDAQLFLHSVTSDNGEITLAFSLCSDNIELYKSDENIGLTLTFKEDKIIRMEHRITVVRRGLDERKLMLQSWYKEQLAPHMPVVMRPIYRMEDSIISASAEWIAEVWVQEEGGRR